MITLLIINVCSDMPEMTNGINTMVIEGDW